jgi:hypothetical protein
MMAQTQSSRLLLHKINLKCKGAVQKYQQIILCQVLTKGSLTGTIRGASFTYSSMVERNVCGG